MPNYLPTLSPVASLPDPLNLNLETAVISGNLHKLYLSPDVGCLNNVIVNGGASNTTDWTNPTSGLAQYWVKGGAASTCTIVTGNGFIGNAQRVESDGGISYIYNNNSTIVGTVNYQASIRYRSSKVLYVETLRTDLGGYSTIGVLNPNTGGAINWSYPPSFILGYNAYIRFRVVDMTATDFFEVDEVYVCSTT